MVQYLLFQMTDEMLQTELWENREWRSLFLRVPFERPHLHHSRRRKKGWEWYNTSMHKQTKREVVKAKKTTAAVVDSAFYAQVCEVFVQARQFVRTTANFAMVKAYWLVGKMIVEKQGGAAKASYGDKLIFTLSERLTADFGKGFTISNLKYMRQFYLAFPIGHTLCDQLSWNHYRLLISVENEEARQYYLEEARKSLWSVRELQRELVAPTSATKRRAA